jgi:hypothetical protein
MTMKMMKILVKMSSHVVMCIKTFNNKWIKHRSLIVNLKRDRIITIKANQNKIFIKSLIKRIISNPVSNNKT